MNIVIRDVLVAFHVMSNDSKHITVVRFEYFLAYSNRPTVNIHSKVHTHTHTIYTYYVPSVFHL